MELTPNQVVDALRKCTNTDSCSGCPYTDERGVPPCSLHETGHGGRSQDHRDAPERAQVTPSG